MIMKRHTLYTSICASALFLASSLIFSACSDEELIESSNIVQTGEGIFFGTTIGNGKWEPDVIGRSVKENKQKPLVIEGGDGFSITATVEDGIKLRNGELKPQSRGTQVTNAVDVKAFDVAAYKNVNGTYEHYFTETVTDGVNPSENRYWPSKGTVDFIATYPQGKFSSQFPTATEYAEGFSLSYTVNENVENQGDIMVAWPKGLNNGENGEAVELQFQHLLTAVQFGVGEIKEGTLRRISIKNIKGGEIRYTYNGKEWATYPESYSSTSAIYNIEGLAQTSIGETTNNDNNLTLLLAPQATPTNSILEVWADYNNDNVQTDDEILTASLAGQTWEQNKTYHYRLNIAGKFNFSLSNTQVMDAHYVIHRTNVTAEDTQGKSWTIKVSSDDKANISIQKVDEMNDFAKTSKIWTDRYLDANGNDEGSARGDDYITITGDGTTSIAIFAPENIQDKNRNIYLTFELDGKEVGKQTLTQLCPAWVGDFGWEQTDDNQEGTFGFNWTRTASYGYVYTAPAWGSDTYKNYCQSIIDANNANSYSSVGTYRYGLTRLRYCININYSNLSNIVTSETEGHTNTINLYNMAGTATTNTFEQVILGILKTENGHTTEQAFRLGNGDTNEAPAPTGENINGSAAVGECLKKNKYNLKKTVSEDGDVGYNLYIQANDIVWYLPAVNQFNSLPEVVGDAIVPANYWSSSVPTEGSTNAYNGAKASIPRSQTLKVRAARNKN